MLIFAWGNRGVCSLKRGCVITATQEAMTLILNARANWETIDVILHFGNKKQRKDLVYTFGFIKAELCNYII